MAVKVLIVEDNPVARSFLCRVVRESFSDELEIAEVGDLESARLAIAADSAASGGSLGSGAGGGLGGGGIGGGIGGGGYRLALLDLELPDGNGLELLAELAGHPATKIVTTLYSDDDHLFPALQCGADGYLLKEDRFEVLVEELQKIVRGQPPLSPAIARRLLTHFRAVGQHSGALGDYMPPTPATQDVKPLAPGIVRERLTPRESEVLVYLSKGFTIKEIASLMGIKWFTVNDHIKSIYKKLNVSSRAEAAVFASKQGLV